MLDNLKRTIVAVTLKMKCFCLAHYYFAEITENFMKRFIFSPLTYLLLALSVSTFAQTDVEGFLKKSAEYNQQDKLDEAAAELSKAIAIQPDNAKSK